MVTVKQGPTVYSDIPTAQKCFAQFFKKKFTNLTQGVECKQLNKSRTVAIIQDLTKYQI